MWSVTPEGNDLRQLYSDSRRSAQCARHRRLVRLYLFRKRHGVQELVKVPLAGAQEPSATVLRAACARSLLATAVSPLMANGCYIVGETAHANIWRLDMLRDADNNSADPRHVQPQSSESLARRTMDCRVVGRRARLLGSSRYLRLEVAFSISPPAGLQYGLPMESGWRSWRVPSQRSASGSATPRDAHPRKSRALRPKAIWSPGFPMGGWRGRRAMHATIESATSRADRKSCW